MISRDYTKEVGIPSQKKTLSRPVALVVLAVVAVGVSFGVAGVFAQAKERRQLENATKPSATAVPAVPVPLPIESTAPAAAK